MPSRDTAPDSEPDLDKLIARAKARVECARKAMPYWLTYAEGELAALERCKRAEVALAKVNDIRNSIIGLQTINWSEHVYPLVAALNDAGIEGMGYPEARARYGTMLERTNAAEAALAAVTAAVQLHHDQRGDDRCHLDDLKLYHDVLGEGVDPYVGALPPTECMLESCRRYVAARRCPGPEGVLPLPGGMTIQQLTEEVEAARGERDRLREAMKDALVFLDEPAEHDIARVVQQLKAALEGTGT